MLVTPWGPPRTSCACSRPRLRCSVRVRGSCLASRVSRVACWASWMAPPPSVGGRGRPGTWWPARRGGPGWRPGGWTSAGSRPGRPRRPHGSGAFPGSVPARSAKVRPSRVRRCFSRAVLYVSEAATLALNRIRPSMASHFPDNVCTLFATATWVCRSGSPARESRCRERGRDQPGDVDLTHPVGALPGVQRVLLDEGQGVGDGVVVGQLDLGRDVRRGDRPQGADGLHRGERQVVPAHRGRAWPGVFGDGPGQLAGVSGVAAVLGPEELRRDLGADPGPIGSSDRVVTGVPQGWPRGPRCASRPPPGTR
jgi:hypothetical protein